MTIMSIKAKRNATKLKKAKNKPVELTKSLTINFTLVTSEYQSAIKVAKILKTSLPDAFHKNIDERLSELEKVAREELLLAFGVVTREGELKETPVYPIEDIAPITDAYQKALSDYYGETSNTGLRDVANYRKLSPVLFEWDVPVLRVASFLNKPEFITLAKSDAMTDEKFDHIMQTLYHCFVTPSETWSVELENKYPILHKGTLSALGLLTEASSGTIDSLSQLEH